MPLTAELQATPPLQLLEFFTCNLVGHLYLHQLLLALLYCLKERDLVQRLLFPLARLNGVTFG